MKTMYAYHWTQGFFRDWSDGELIVIAENIDDARELAQHAIILYNNSNPLFRKLDDDESREMLLARTAMPYTYKLPIHFGFSGNN